MNNGYNYTNNNNNNINSKFFLNSHPLNNFTYLSNGTHKTGSSNVTMGSKKSSSSNNINYAEKIDSNINPNMNSIKEENMDIEEIEDDIFLKICNKHAINLSKNYDYNQNQAENEINSLLIEMDSFGYIVKKKIKEERINNPHKYLTLEESFTKDYLPLTLLKIDLENNNCTCEIEREEAKDEMQKKEAFTAIQFIFNGMYKLNKYIFKINTKNNQIDLNFTNNLRVYLSKIWNIETKDIILNTNFIYSGFISAIIKASEYNELDVSFLLSKLESEFNSDISEVDKTILLNGCRINKIWLKKNKINKWEESNSNSSELKRGGKPYIRPVGYIGFLINIEKRFDDGNDDWYNINTKNEWSIAYHCTKEGINNYYKNNVIYHNNNNIEKGIYMTPNPEIMEKSCSELHYSGKKYKLGIMCRLRPDKIRCPNGFNNYYIINGTDNEIRPFRFLIKEYS